MNSNTETRRNHREFARLAARAMERELEANRHKGNWDRLDWDSLVHELEHHVRKMYSAFRTLRDGDSGEDPQILANRCIEFAADVCNCAMFFADNHGLLTDERVESRRAEDDFMEDMCKTYFKRVLQPA